VGWSWPGCRRQDVFGETQQEPRLQGPGATPGVLRSLRGASGVRGVCVWGEPEPGGAPGPPLPAAPTPEPIHVWAHQQEQELG